MNGNRLTSQFHDNAFNLSAIDDGTEPLGQLVHRLGPPPDDIIQRWRASTSELLPDDFHDWDLDALGLTPSAHLVRIDHRHTHVDLPPTPTNATQANAAQTNEIQSSQTLDQNSKPASPQSRPHKRRHALLPALLLAGSAAVITGLALWVFRSQDEPDRVAQTAIEAPPSSVDSSRPNIFSPERTDIDTAPRTNSRQPSPRPTSQRSPSSAPPSTQPLETLSLLEPADTTASPEPASVSPIAPAIDPATFAAGSLIAPPDSPDSSNANAPASDDDINPLLKSTPLVATAVASTAGTPSPAPATMEEVLATGDDAPPNEKPQHVREPSASSDAADTDSSIETDPLRLSIESSDQQPSWNLKQPIPSTGVRLSITFKLPSSINEGWIEPLDETSPRRARAVAVLTPEDEETVAIAIRMDIRCNAKLSIRLRFAARLDPTLPWQLVSRDTLLRSIDQVGALSLAASSQLTQIESVYSKADTYERRAIRTQRDAVKLRSEQLKLVLQRLGDLRELTDKLEQEGQLLINLSAEKPTGTQTLLETVEKAPAT